MQMRCLVRARFTYLAFDRFTPSRSSRIIWLTHWLTHPFLHRSIAGDAFFQMPPFRNDVVSTYFAHYHNNPIPGNDMVRFTYLSTRLPIYLPTY